MSGVVLRAAGRATRLDLIQPPGCSARFPYASFALPILTLNQVSMAVMPRLLLLMSRTQREEHRAGLLHHVGSHYDLRTREMVRECFACGAIDVIPIPGNLDDQWRTVDAPAEFPEELLRWEIDSRTRHHACAVKEWQA